MATREKDQICAGLVEKLSSGQPLDAAEKDHLIECESCMTELVRRLDEAAEEASNSLGKNGHSAQDDLSRSRLEAKQAVEHGRRVFAREFGIS